MELLWQLIVGLIVGVVARLLMPGKEALPEGVLGVVLTAVIGVVGALIGGFIGRTLLPWADSGYTAGWIMSIIGALILLLAVRLLFGRGGTQA